jgi:hypothetical protein
VAVRSGDVLVGEFGQMPHAVAVPADDNAPPSWWSRCDTFGTKRRCNVLFRQVRRAYVETRQHSEHARGDHVTLRTATVPTRALRATRESPWRGV